jgi:hypothetical protein
MSKYPQVRATVAIHGPAYSLLSDDLRGYEEHARSLAKLLGL